MYTKKIVYLKVQFICNPNWVLTICWEKAAVNPDRTGLLADSQGQSQWWSGTLEVTRVILQLLGKVKGWLEQSDMRTWSPAQTVPAAGMRKGPGLTTTLTLTQQGRDRRAAEQPGPQPAPSAPPVVLGDLRQLWAKGRLGGLPQWTAQCMGGTGWDAGENV